MATQQAYQAYAESNKGTLVPGQTISVNKYTVQVERYLSQGGFAHVYLVRTPTAVYGTTHHVLKRIAVANESMLSEVKKEVDVMRVLKGHPNIVHLIDAAWHRMPNGMYEVFILMEFCPGGGIIDMMNRRLRERLTEAEILQIFVDVCEGVAFMHNSRPPLLHRDLKVENILQSTPTSYKLCDFGSATTVSRPPTNTQEIRALEAEIGRHTTMQYRAPEMIDLYSKRPIDEKSDVWALGVLLYKLCYYTTPFEEHGSLAILNVQYRIPPYPMYSSQMNMLIGSMLREHGSQRPAVYEVLNHVHYLRGTKSQFTYSIPVAQPTAPRQPQQNSNSAAQSQTSGATSSNYAVIPPFSNGARNTHTAQPQTNAGAQAREKVLEAIAPMRRGRPTNLRDVESSSRQPSPQKSSTPAPPNTAPPAPGRNANWLDKEEAAWKATSTQAKARDRANALFDEAWKVSGPPAKTEAPQQGPTGFENDFTDKVWHTPNLSFPSNASPSPQPSTNPVSSLRPSGSSIKPLSHTGSDAIRSREKDAFEGLGLMTSFGRPAPTLAEARKLRTGLAIMSTQSPQQRNGYSASEIPAKPPGASGQTSRPTPSPRPSYLSPASVQTNSMSRSPSPGIPSNSSWRQHHSRSSPSVFDSAPSAASEGTPIEARFPSLEEIDAKFTTTSLYPTSTRLTERESRFITQPKPSSSEGIPQLPPRPPKFTDEPTQSIHSAPPTTQTTGLEGLHKKFDAQSVKSDRKFASYRSESNDSLNMPTSVLRPKRSSTTMKYALEGLPSSSSIDSGSNRATTMQEEKYSRSPKPPPKDWLTGDDEEPSTPVKKQNTRGGGGSSGAVLRDTPMKRTSVIIPKDFKFQSPVAAQHDVTPVSRTQELPTEEESPTVSRFTRSFPPIDTAISNEPPHSNESLTDNWSPVDTRQPQRPSATKPKPELDPASSADEDGPEDLGTLTNTPHKKLMSLRKRKGRQSSVHDLVDLWGGGLGSKEKTSAELASPKPYSMQEKATPKPRPTSLMPPSSSGAVKYAGGLSPKLSPVQRAPSPISPSPSFSPSYETFKERTVTPSPNPNPRSRPQSMFIFPAKTIDTQASTSTSSGLPLSSSPSFSPPAEEEIPRGVPRRRTSISNMVQRYEAIGGKVILPQQVAAGGPITRKVSVNRSFPQAPPPVENVRVKVLPVPDKSDGKRTGPGPRDDFRPIRAPVAEPLKVRTRTMSTGPVQRPIDIPRPTVASAARTSPIDIRKSDVVGPGRGAGHGREPTTTNVFPKRKPTLPEEILSPPASGRGAVEEELSSSPERPYQGVGRLIDQWQRKSEETAAGGAGPGPAIAVLPKRAGLVNGSNRV